MQYLDRDKNPITPERWQWIAVYRDGTELSQFDNETGTYHYFSEIDQSQVKMFCMTKPSQKSLVSHYVAVPKDAHAVHYYDNLIQHHMNADSTSTKLYCFGYEHNGIREVWSINEDDSITKVVDE